MRRPWRRDHEIGFIGLGIMGLPMSRNLIKGGHELVVSGHSADSAEELSRLGARVAQLPSEIAAEVDLIITMLPNSPEVLEVALGADGIVHGAHDGLVYVDMSSIAPRACREVHDALTHHGVPMLDAPVSGGEPKAVDGTLSIMVGGDPQVYDRAREVLALMGSTVVRVGDIGAGNTAKLANQVVVALNIAAVSEALVLASSPTSNPSLSWPRSAEGLPAARCWRRRRR